MAEMFTVDRPKESTHKRIADALEVIALNTGEDSSEITDWSSLKRIVRGGFVKKVLQVGDKLRATKETSLSVTVTGGISAATVNEDTFIAKTGHTGTAAYEFTFDGAAWHLHGEEVELAAYGITATGTPHAEDTIVVHEVASDIIFDVVAIDYDVPVNEDLEHSITLLTQDCMHYSAIPYCASQALFAVAADQFADGMPAGTYTVNSDHAAYNESTTEDGPVHFTTTLPVPVGGKIRHSSIGQYRGSGYARSYVLAGTFTTYDAEGTIIESGIATVDGEEGTVLGTTTAQTPSYKVGAHMNYSQRNIYGSNNFQHSAQQKWRDSDAAGAASGQIASWWYPSDEWDMPVKSTMPGFLHGFDPEFIACIAQVRKRTLLHKADRTGAAAYVDTIMRTWAPSMTEMGFGANDGTYETPANADGTLATQAAFDMFVGAENVDRIKSYGGSARYWWLRSPYPWNANGVRYVAPAGALSNGSDAYYTNGGVAGLVIA